MTAAEIAERWRKRWPGLKVRTGENYVGATLDVFLDEDEDFFFLEGHRGFWGGTGCLDEAEAALAQRIAELREQLREV